MHRWLRYFFSKDAVYYAPCILLGPKNSKEKSFSIELSGDWKNLSSLTARHFKDDSPHYDNIKAARRFTAEFFVSSKEKKHLSTSYPGSLWSIEKYCVFFFRLLHYMLNKIYHCVVMFSQRAIVLPCWNTELTVIQTLLLI